jgi:tyrosinase
MLQSSFTHNLRNRNLQQRLYEIMVDVVIPSFPKDKQAELTAAANAWRFPYWDWAAKKVRDPSKPAGYYVPLIVENKMINVVTPLGPTIIPNPMYAFTTPFPMGTHGIVGFSDIPVAYPTPIQ